MSSDGQLPGQSSPKVPDTHSVGSICDHDFGVFTVANITDGKPPMRSASAPGPQDAKGG